MDVSAPSLWRHAEFTRLWVGQTIAQIGSQITFVALPLLAILLLDATPAQMGLLTALEALPSLLVGLHAGAMVDRHRRRPVLVLTSLGRAVILALVPLAWFAGMMSLELLCVVVFLIGGLGLFFDVAYQAFLPLVAPRSRVMEANSKLELSRTAAEVAGPSLAGWLIQALTAPVAIAANALAYLGTALVLARIRVVETVAVRPAAGRRWLAEIGDGLRAVFGDPALRPIAGSSGVLGLFNAMLEAVFFLFVARDLGLGPAIIGLVFAVGSVGFIVGSVLPTRLTPRFGLGPLTIAAVALVGLSDVLVALAPAAEVIAVSILIFAEFCFGVGLTVFRVNQASLRQIVVPPYLQGRASATVRFLALGLAPVGALLGGAMAEALGVRPTLLIAAVGELGAAAWLWWSPVRSMRAMPELLEADDDPVALDPGGRAE